MAEERRYVIVRQQSTVDDIHNVGHPAHMTIDHMRLIGEADVVIVTDLFGGARVVKSRWHDPAEATVTTIFAEPRSD